MQIGLTIIIGFPFLPPTPFRREKEQIRLIIGLPPSPPLMFPPSFPPFRREKERRSDGRSKREGRGRKDDVSAEIEEANALRAQLGLAPLR